MLIKLIANTDQIAIFFYNRREKGSYEAILDGLETIDDELDEYEIPFVKISSRDISLEFGFEAIPALAFFQLGVPANCEANLMEEQKVLKWILLEVSVVDINIIFTIVNIIIDISIIFIISLLFLTFPSLSL